MRQVSSRYNLISKMSEQELLSTPICELDIGLSGTWVEAILYKAKKKLKSKLPNLEFSVWISDEWFCPDGVVGFAMPFYLLHPRLAKIQKKYTGEAEGYGLKWCESLIYHELGHVVDNAYKLGFDRNRVRLFGDPNAPYPKSYRANVYSKDFVRHLSHFYAQSHPAEDFAETFAVWLRNGPEVFQKYKDWPALAKLIFLDKLMRSIHSQRASVVNKQSVDPVKDMKMRFRTFIKRGRFEAQKYENPAQRIYKL